MHRGRRYRVTHRTSYRYDDDVSSSFGRAHLVPRDRDRQTCERADGHRHPEPGRAARAHRLVRQPLHLLRRHHPAPLADRAGRERRDDHRPGAATGRRRAGRRCATGSPSPARNRRRTTTGELLEARGYTLPSPRLPPLAAAADYARHSFPAGRPLDEAAVDLIGRIHRDFRYVSGATHGRQHGGRAAGPRRGRLPGLRPPRRVRAALAGAGRPLRQRLPGDHPAARPGTPGRRGRLARLGVGVHRRRLAGPGPDQRPGRRRRPTWRWRTAGTTPTCPRCKGVIFSDSTESVMRVAVDIVRVDGGVGTAMRSFTCPTCRAPGVLRELRLPELRHRAGLLPTATGPWSRHPDRCANADARRLQLAARPGRAALRLLRAHPDPTGRHRPRRAWPRSPGPRRPSGGWSSSSTSWACPPTAWRFDLLSSTEQPVTTGHADGVVTIDLAEGDDPHREALRVQLAEPYRTLLGHLRHETGHWYWTVLVEPDPEPFRALFGDERADYAAALERHYGGSPPAGLGGDRGEHLRHRAPVGGLGRDVRALPAHPGHAADGRGVRVDRRRPGRGRRRPRWPPTPTADPKRLRRRSSTPGCR